MARNRQVFPRDEVAHLWANGAQDSARDASGNMFFTGPTLYSYGTHYVIGHILSDECGAELAGRVLWNDSTYSNTTSTMKSDAWRALSATKRERSLSMPGLTESQARATDRALAAKKLPEYTELLLSCVRTNVAALDGKKHGSGPFEHALHAVKKYQDVAMLFYARAGRKYPLPVYGGNSDSVPADKVERAAFILSYAKADIQRQQRQHVTSATRIRDDIIRSLEIQQAAYGYEQLIRQAGHAHEHCIAAQAHYRTLNACKTSPTIARLAKDIQTRISPVADMLAAVKRDTARKHAETTVADFARLSYLVKRDKFGVYKWQRDNAQSSLADIVYRADGIASELVELGTPAGSWLHGMARRLARMNAADASRRLLVDVTNRLDSAESFDPKFPGDAKRDYQRAIQRYDHAAQLAPSIVDRLVTRDMVASSIPARIGAARARMFAIDADIAARNAEVIRAWCAGESDERPSYEVGALARFNRTRTAIETTQGANVPVEHACRLSRMFAIALRRGGQSWPDGAGPMVGHYRVQRIGADGSLTIGCHEFSAAEGHRLHSLLATCKECAEVTQGESA